MEHGKGGSAAPSDDAKATAAKLLIMSAYGATNWHRPAERSTHLPFYCDGEQICVTTRLFPWPLLQLIFAVNPDAVHNPETEHDHQHERAAIAD
jgi:hypothetical protein